MIAEQGGLRAEEPADFWTDPRMRRSYGSRLRDFLEPPRLLYWRLATRLEGHSRPTVSNPDPSPWLPHL